MRSIPLTLTVVLMISLAASATQIDDKVADRLYESTTALDAMVNAPDGGIPKTLLKDAKCLAVIPGLKKAAIGLGGNYGRGVVSCRQNEGKGDWGPPSMIAMSGGSFGFQLGGQSADVVMLFMTPDSMKHLLKDKVALGVDAAATGGPIGREASAQTNATMRSENLTYARSRGLFAGISLKGAVLKPDQDANKALYKRDVEAKDLLVDGKGTVPDTAQKFVATVSRTTSQ
jgi:lipid-binding SYLF domain-containing protein